MDFPISEHDDVLQQIQRGMPLWTTRIDAELGVWHAGQIVETPFGMLKVESVERITNIRQYQYYNELTPEQQNDLGLKGIKALDVIKLVKPK